MHSQLRPLTWAAPCALGFCAYAAILLTDGTDELSWIRFTIAALVLVGVSAGGVYALGRTQRGRRMAEDPGPDCERCGNPTGKPFLYNDPHQHWRCEDCEREVTDILFTAAENGRLTDSMLRAAGRPSPTDRTAENLSALFLRLGPPTDRTAEK